MAQATAAIPATMATALTILFIHPAYQAVGYDPGLMKVDYYFPPQPPLAATEAARRAVRLGYDGFFSAETRHDPFLPLGFAAQEAPDLDLGTAIAVAFARSPMVVAQTAWDFAAMSHGSFILGLGTQVKAHITRRFSGSWDAPAARLREYVLALRAIWNTFQTGERLSFQGDHYSFSLMTPFFDPGPISHPDIPVAIAGVGPHLSRLAGEVCDGFHVHPFHTVKYLDDVVLPNIAEGAARRERSPSDVSLISTVFVVTGRDEAEMEMMAAAVKQQISFYASTPSYRPVLDAHGWDFGERLNLLSRRGEWAAMADVITDEVLREVAVIAPPDRIGEAVRDRYEGRIDRIGFYALAGTLELADEEWAAAIVAAKA